MFSYVVLQWKFYPNLFIMVRYVNRADKYTIYVKCIYKIVSLNHCFIHCLICIYIHVSSKHLRHPPVPMPGVCANVWHKVNLHFFLNFIFFDKFIFPFLCIVTWCLDSYIVHLSDKLTVTIQILSSLWATDAATLTSSHVAWAGEHFLPWKITPIIIASTNHL